MNKVTSNLYIKAYIIWIVASFRAQFHVYIVCGLSFSYALIYNKNKIEIYLPYFFSLFDLDSWDIWRSNIMCRL